jgi:hypothetical protein
VSERRIPKVCPLPDARVGLAARKVCPLPDPLPRTGEGNRGRRERSAGSRRLGAPCVLSLALLAVASGACSPALDDRPWLITRTTIVGWKAEPPEVAPGASVMLEAIAIDPSAAIDPTATAWTLCHTPKPPSENRVVAPACLAPTRPPDTAGNPVSLAIPTEACRLFGPDVPQPPPGQPTTRARDADATGGYFQPVTVALGSALAIGLERVTCDLPEASLADARAFQAAYHANQNPTLAGLTIIAADGSPIDPTAIGAGTHLTIQATWLAGAIETFPVFDRQSRTILDAAETLTASWYVTSGTLDAPAAEIADPTATSTATGWTAPASPTTVELAMVLRDSRGGSDVARATLVVVGP